MIHSACCGREERLGCAGLAPEGLNGIDRNVKQRLLFVFAWLVKESGWSKSPRAHNFNFPGRSGGEWKSICGRRNRSLERCRLQEAEWHRREEGHQ